ncbi:MAG: CBS domain-containing protein [Phycisphaerae bacterium]|nr:CBS domain-containing protein [Phycisphaerae bacterium]
MQVKETMTNRVKAISADATVRQAAEEMAAINVGVLPVARDQMLVGMLTDRDITIRVVGQGLDPNKTLAGDAMTSGVLTVREDQEIEEVVQAMREKQIRRAPVLDANQRLVGIVSLGDLAAKGGDLELSGAALKGVSEPAEPNL